MTTAQELQSGIAQLGVQLSEERQLKLLAYLALLHKWNKVYNLTAIREPERMVSHHLLDNIAVMPHLWPGRWLDVGSGAGLPGIILAIMRPEWQFTLLDSNSKKTSFVQQAVIELGIINVTVCCERVEDFRPTEKYDGIISRAFTDLGSFLRTTRHLVSPQGGWAAMKGLAERELADVPRDCQIDRVIPLQVPGLNAARSLVIATCKGSEANEQNSGHH